MFVSSQQCRQPEMLLSFLSPLVLCVEVGLHRALRLGYVVTGLFLCLPYHSCGCLQTFYVFFFKCKKKNKKPNPG